MRFDHSLRLFQVSRGVSDVHGQMNRRFQPELSLPVRVGGVHVFPSLFPREEAEAKRPVADDGRGPPAIVAEARGQAA